ncbi:MAG TPA: GerMN domain-containing protein [Planococcus sp. (in: firmicutes)]|nr:GerMN domain-containing protein [Planococcus sp. (in: firmicutes)]
MPNNRWDDDHIENLLRDFPTIRDDRTKEEVYSRIDKKAAVKKQPKRWLPLLVAALAFITIGFLVASILSQNGIDNAFMPNEEHAESTADKAQDASTEEAESPEAAGEESNGSASSDGQEPAATEESATAYQDENPQSAHSAVYEEQLEGFTLFTIGLTENAMVIPVGFLIPDMLIANDFGNTAPNSVELYNQYASQIDEPAIGFNEYHPYLGRLSVEDGTVKHILPADHQYDLASASYEVYIASLQATFTDAKEILIQNEDGTPADFDQIGPMEPVKPAVENVAYYAHTTAGGETFLVPGYNMPHATAKEAVEAMKTAPSDLHQNTIPESVDYTVTETDTTVTIQFTAQFDFGSMEEVDGARMLESLALTAKAFDKSAQLENTKQQEWSGFDLSRPLPEPVAPNGAAWKVK